MKKFIGPVIFGAISWITLPIFGLFFLLGTDGVGDDTRGHSILLLIVITIIMATYSVITNGISKIVSKLIEKEYPFLLGTLITLCLSTFIYVLLTMGLIIFQTF